MNSWLFAPIFVGMLIVGQSILNENIGHQYGLSIALFINAAVFLILAGILLCLSGKFHFSANWFPDFINPKWANYQFQWWHLLPGIGGFFLVLLIPWSILNLSPGTVFLLLVSSQIVFSILWDFVFNHTPITSTKILSIICVIAGAFFYTK